ncbi:MAG: alanine--tRNA ligase [Candidatus Marinimicrobia bacterium]|nr:alanine--tRNA ligase [Candidatus Neomarinimicrobiota bacterium]
MKYSSKKIRQDFIDFFIDKQHNVIRSSPVFPPDDPSLLFINAGMNQFKNIFLEKENPKYNRVVNSQKCIRVSGKHNDLEEVGLDQYHHTFFEMLGNWSFGDFYKKEIIMWSWELLTEKWKLDKNRLWVTVYKDDDEAHDLWIKHTDVKPDRVLRFGNKDNFWEMGDTGPCGPCSEIHYYTGELNNQKADGVNNLDNYRELWNLVFIEYNRESNGELNPLPSKHVDTGMGLERILATLNGIEDHYMTDLFHPIIKQIEQISGINYSDKDGMPHRVIADHLRMISFSIADGIMPSNEGRGYVVRRVLRRASRFGRVLNIEGPFLFKLIDALIISMGDVYSEISDKQKHIEKVVRAEEESFGKTLDRGLNLINKLLASSEEKVIPGKQVFTLYDTYGFPADLTQLIAKENNFDIDMNSFNDYMEKQKKLARSSSQFKNLNEDTDWKIIKNEESSFVGYTKTSYESQILKYRFIDDNIEIVMEETPFYAESGGQIGDTGKIFSDSLTLKVIDTYKNGGDICHLCEVIEGEFLKNTSATFKLTINEKRRKKIKSNHSATHLLHKSLKSVLGNHVQQAGSLVSDDKLRFDLTHYEKLTQNEILEIENNVNEYIMQNLEVDISNEKYDKAKKMGAEALFGEKYGDIVRVVNIGGSSIELCGGTHVERSGDIGFFKIISESALASGVRRVEAVTGSKAFSFVSDNMKVIDNIKQKLNCNIEDISNKIDSLINTSKQNSVLEKQIQQIQIDSLLKSSEPNFSTNDKIDIYKSEIKFNVDPKTFIDNFLNKYKNKSIFLLGLKINKPLIVLVITKDLIDKDINAGLIVKENASLAGSGGGGPKHFGTSGFNDLSKYEKTYNMILNYLKGIKI